MRYLAGVMFAAAVLAGSTPASGDVTSGLVSRYTFDVDAQDSVGSNHGTLENGASIVSDPVRGNVLSLDGTDDHVSLPASGLAAGRSELTLTMWIKPDEWVSDNTIYDEYGGDWNEYWQFSILEGGWYTRDATTGPTGSRDNDLPIPAVTVGEWHHLAFVYSVSGSTKAIYYDGAPYDDTSNSVDTLTTDRGGVAVGRPCDGTYYDGMVDELRLYDRALTPGEIAELGAATTYALTVNSGSGDGDYAAGVQVSISADPAPSGQGFSVWTGDIATVANPSAPDTTITMPSSDAEVTATYATAYTLTVDSGSGDGQYGAGAVVGISADAPGSGYVFEEWVGDTTAVVDTGAVTTSVTMPASDVTVTASYTAFVGYYLTVESGSGDGSYDEGAVISISADPAPSGKVFNMWAGDPDGFAGWDEMKTSSTTYTMPAQHMTLTATYRLPNSPDDWWPYFDAFCKAHFGAELEPLAYDMHGSTLTFLSRSGSEWSYVSETSASVAFETNLPAKTYVEYGQTTSYGSQAVIETDRYYYLHLAYLTDLLPDTLYHYRYVAQDERGNAIYSPDKTFTTATPANVIYVPGGVSGPPYNLTQSGRTYLVTQDLVCNRTAFEVQADNITIDLGGHRVTYNEEDYQVSSNFIGTSPFGVRVYNHSNVTVVNGTIKQGAGCNDSDSDGLGYNPILAYQGSGEIMGVSMEYIGGSLKGIGLHYPGPWNVHHNVILDRGAYIADRHAGAPYGVRYATNPHHNLLKRVRQNGVSGKDGSDVYGNEVYVDSCATNAFAISLYSVEDQEVYDNRAFGTGYLVVGYSATGSIFNLDIHDNYTHLQAIKADTRFDEYGAQSGAYCFRITNYGATIDNIRYDSNYGITYGRHGGADGMGGMVRGVWITAGVNVTNCSFTNNVLKAVLTTLDTYTQGCVVHCGTSDTGTVPIIYENNRLISNFCNARMGEDYYGAGQNAEFYDNTFVRVGPDRPDYRTIGVGYSGYRSAGHKFYDSSFEGGAGYDQIRFDGSGVRNFSVGWTLTVETEPLNDVTIRNVGSSVVFTGQANGSGLCDALLLEYLHEPTGKTYYTPHSVTVDDGVDNRTESVTVDATKTVQIYLQETYVLTVTNGSGSGNYDEGEIVAISADAPDSGKLFAAWIGDTIYLDDPASADTNVTMPAADVSVTAVYGWGYTLTVNSGTGDGLYPSGAVVDIDADAPLTNMQFDEWIGDTGQVGNVQAESTTFTMPAYDCEVTATYSPTLPGDLDGNGSVGQGDLDIILDSWGESPPSDPRADPSGDGSVGQADLDIVLDHWGESI